MKRIDKQTVLLACVMVTTMSVIVSNIITNKQLIAPWGLAMTCGAFCIPLSYICDDILAEIYGFKTARMVTLLGFAAGLLAVLYFQVTILVDGAESFTSQEAFETVLGATARTTFASFVAFLAGSILNAKIMELLHTRDGEDKLAVRCIVSTVIGEIIDMCIFALLAFAGTMPWVVIGQVIFSNALVKIAIEIVLYPILTRWAICWVKNLPES